MDMVARSIPKPLPAPSRPVRRNRSGASLWIAAVLAGTVLGICGWRMVGRPAAAMAPGVSTPAEVRSAPASSDGSAPAMVPQAPRRRSEYPAG